MKYRGLVLTGVLVLTTGLALAAAEALVRRREWKRSTTPGIMPTLYYRHARLPHALVRDYSYFGWFHTDSTGFRLNRNAQRPPGGRPVVLVLGESTTFDTSVSPDSSAWPARVEAWVRAERPDWPGIILNGGVSGYTVVDNLVRLETDLAEFHPDVIVVYHGHNDLYSTLVRAVSPRGGFTQRPGKAETLTPWRVWLEEHSLLYTKVMGRIRALQFRSRRISAGERATPDWDAAITKGADRFERDLRSVLAVAGVRRIPVVVMSVTHVSGRDTLPPSEEIVASWANTMPGVPVPVIMAGYRQFRTRTRLAAESFGVPFIDGLASGVAGVEAYAPGDAIHFNNQGADRFARYVAERLSHVLPDSMMRARAAAIR